jgi:DNA-binding NarL/FixJ family response regulator
MTPVSFAPSGESVAGCASGKPQPVRPASLPSSALRAIVLVEDDAALRAGLVEVLAGEPDFTVLADFATAEEAIRWDGWAGADVLLADFHLPGLDGVELIAAAVEANPDLLAAIWTASAESKNVIAALKAGARGYVVKNDPVFGVADSIRMLLAGNAPISPLVASQVLDFFNRSGKGAQELSPREIQVLRMVAQGLIHKEIAAAMGVTVNTVQTHTRRAYRKLGASRRTQALQQAKLHRLI